MSDHPEEYTGDNLPLEIEDRKNEIAEQYKEYVDSFTRKECLDRLTLEQLREKIIDDDYLGSDDWRFEPK